MEIFLRKFARKDDFFDGLIIYYNAYFLPLSTILQKCLFLILKNLAFRIFKINFNFII